MFVRSEEREEAEDALSLCYRELEANNSWLVRDEGLFNLDFSQFYKQRMQCEPKAGDERLILILKELKHCLKMPRMISLAFETYVAANSKDYSTAEAMLGLLLATLDQGYSRLDNHDPSHWCRTSVPDQTIEMHQAIKYFSLYCDMEELEKQLCDFTSFSRMVVWNHCYENRSIRIVANRSEYLNRLDAKLFEFLKSKVQSTRESSQPLDEKTLQFLVEDFIEDYHLENRKGYGEKRKQEAKEFLTAIETLDTSKLRRYNCFDPYKDLAKVLDAQKDAKSWILTRIESDRQLNRLVRGMMEAVEEV